MTAPLLALLQFSDSGFPAGAFTHSYGLEQLLSPRLLSGGPEVEAFVRSVIAQGIATCDARSAFAACAAAREGDVECIAAADLALYRRKAARELRQACVETGRRLLEEAAVHLDLPVLTAYAGAVQSGVAPGCHPTVFGAVNGALGVEPGDAAAALQLTTAHGLLQAAMRLGRISHRDAQAVLHRLRPLIAAQQPGSADLSAFHPLQEIASMQHERAQARLFAS